MKGEQKASPEGPQVDTNASREATVVLAEASREGTALDRGPYGGDGPQTRPDGAAPSSGARATKGWASVAPVQGLELLADQVHALMKESGLPPVGFPLGRCPPISRCLRRRLQQLWRHETLRNSRGCEFSICTPVCSTAHLAWARPSQAALARGLAAKHTRWIRTTTASTSWRKSRTTSLWRQRSEEKLMEGTRATHAPASPG
jgi:hypothetical protein